MTILPSQLDDALRIPRSMDDPVVIERPEAGPPAANEGNAS
jgi:hypothetical protein